MRGLKSYYMKRGQTDGHVDSVTNSARRAELVKDHYKNGIDNTFWLGVLVFCLSFRSGSGSSNFSLGLGMFRWSC